MTKHRLIGIRLILAILLASTGTAILAQTETPTIIPPPNFADGRINDTVLLGDLAIYCVDANSNTHVRTFENGAITVWGVGDQKYINLNAAQLRGSVEISQPAPVTEAEMTEEAVEMMEVAPEATGQEPVLLARATTPSGEIGFFSLGDDQFVLQGHDEKGNFFTYSWTGCSTGSIDRTTKPFRALLEATGAVKSPEMMTPEATASS